MLRQLFLLFGVLSSSISFSDRAAAEDPPPSSNPSHASSGDDSVWEPIPKTLDEAHVRLEQLFPSEELAAIDAMSSEDEMIRYHMGFGMGLRNNWGLWRNSQLAQNLRAIGFMHPDDMSGMILETFWCKRHKKPFRLDERAASFRRFWEATADPPETAVDPKDGSAINWYMAFGPGSDFRTIHVGKSRSSGRILVYEPDDELRERINKSGSK